jgi:putative SOS response-associated peptidase YedK
MCARYTLSKKQEQILKGYSVTLAEAYSPNYNLAPTQEGLIITADEPSIAQKMHFGLLHIGLQTQNLILARLTREVRKCWKRKHTLH